MNYVAVPMPWTPDPDPRAGELRVRDGGLMLVDLLVFLGMAASKSEAR